MEGSVLPLDRVSPPSPAHPTWASLSVHRDPDLASRQNLCSQKLRPGDHGTRGLGEGCTARPPHSGTKPLGLRLLCLPLRLKAPGYPSPASKGHFLCDRDHPPHFLSGTLRPKRGLGAGYGELEVKPLSFASQGHPSTRKCQVRTPNLPVDQLGRPEER